MKFKFLVLILITSLSQAQFLDDKESKEITKRGLDQIYNLQFDKSEETLSPIKKEYANHPLKYLLNAVRLEWEYSPIDKNPAKLKLYLAELEKCKKAAKDIYPNPKFKKESLFFLIAAHGFVALVHNHQHEFFAAASEAKKANDYFKESKKYKTDNAEFMLISGLYNFYIVQYPESHPIVRPAMVFFEKGNKIQGLNELEIASKQSVFSRVEAANYLSNMYLKYMSNYKKALFFATEVYQKYPANFIFKIKYIECLLLNKDFGLAEKLNNTLENRKDNISQVSYLVFDGYIEEYQKKDLNKAMVQYAKALKLPSDSRYTIEYHGMAYLGLGKIFAAKNDKSKAKYFLNKCLDISEYEWLQENAKNELKKL